MKNLFRKHYNLNQKFNKFSNNIQQNNLKIKINKLKKRVKMKKNLKKKKLIKIR